MKPLKYLKIIVSVLIYLIISLQIIFAQELNLQYDAVGNLVTGDGFYREYDGFNHLIRIRNGNLSSGDITEEFIWHPVEERVFIKKIYWNNQSLRTTIKYLNENTIKIKNESGTFYENYIYQDSQLIALVDNNNKKFIHGDHLGSTSLITDLGGNLLENTFFSPTGEILSGGEESRFDYSGNEFDDLTNELDYGARMYKPDWIKFLKPDIISYELIYVDLREETNYNPQELNVYSFVLNNPYKNIDPNGLWTVQIGGSGTGGSVYGGTYGKGVIFGYGDKVFEWGTYKAVGHGVYVGYGASGTADVSVSGNKQIGKIGGLTLTIGGSGTIGPTTGVAGAGFGVGAEKNIPITSTGIILTGTKPSYTISGGVSAGSAIEGHAFLVSTTVTPRGSISFSNANRNINFQVPQSPVPTPSVSNNNRKGVTSTISKITSTISNVIKNIFKPKQRSR